MKKLNEVKAALAKAGMSIGITIDGDGVQVNEGGSVIYTGSSPANVTTWLEGVLFQLTRHAR